MRLFALAACYMVPVVAITWPLAAHLETHLGMPWIIAHFDTLRLIWSLAWETHALSTDPFALLDANIYYPNAHALAYGQMAFGLLPYFAPVQLATGNPTLALNFTWLASAVLSCVSLHWVVHRFTGSELSGVIAAATLLGTRWLFWDYAGFAQNYAVVQYLPLILYGTAHPPKRVATRLSFIGLVVLQSLSDIYLAACVFAVLGLLALWQTTRVKERAGGRRLLALLIPAAVLVTPFYAPHISVALANPDLTSQTLWLTSEAFDQAWIFSRLRGPIAVPPLILCLIAMGTLTFYRSAARRAHTGGETLGVAWRRALFFTVVGLVISSPQLNSIINGGEPLRGYVRLGSAAWIGLCVLAGLSFAQCAAWLAGRADSRTIGTLATMGLFAVCIGGIYADFAYSLGRPAAWSTASRISLPADYPLKPAIQPHPKVIELLRASDAPLLEIGAQVEGRGSFGNARAMYHSIFHWTPLLNGYGSYYPAGFSETMKLASALPNRDALQSLYERTGVGWVLVFRSHLMRADVPRWREVVQAGPRQSGLEVALDDGDVLLFRVRL